MEGRQGTHGRHEEEEGDGDARGAPVLGRDRAGGAPAEGGHREREEEDADGARQTPRGLHAVRSADGGRPRDSSS